DFAADLPDPPRAPRAEVTRLGDEEGLVISLPNRAQHPMQRGPAIVARLIFPPQAAAYGVPLIGMIEVHSQDVQIPIVSTELRPQPSRNHVPRLVLGLIVCLSRGSHFGLVFRSDHVNDRFRINKARTPIDIPYRFASRNHGADELLFELIVPALLEGIHNGARCSPREE